MEDFNKLKRLGDRQFCETFKSLQLLAFTVLYYNFGMETEELTRYNDLLKKKNYELLDDLVKFDTQTVVIENIWGKKVTSAVKEFPYRAKVKMMGGYPKKLTMQKVNMAIAETGNAIRSYIILSFSTLMEMDKKFGKVQMDLFWSNMMDNSLNYANGMTDEFIVDYFVDQLGLELREQ